MNEPKTKKYMELKMTIKELKKEIEHIVLSDIGKADKVEKLWDFFIDNVDTIKNLKE